MTTYQKQLGEKLENHLKWLESLSADPQGGISRLLYAPTWVKTQHALKELFEEQGLNTFFDDVGNLFGRLEGTTYKQETILTGSHIDSVKNGGIYDGQFGIIASFYATTFLKENYGAPLRPIEVVSMAEEEGSRFPFTFWGSKNIIGHVTRKKVKHLKDVEGITFDEAIKKAGFTYPKREDVRTDLKAFIEVHVEQGNVLEKKGKQVGIVDHIVGQRRMTVTVEGEANHAGTTPMGYRTDAMNAAARMVAKLNDLALSYGDPLVATVGQITLEPNVINVIPRKAEFSLDIRHTDNTLLDQFSKEVESQFQNIADKLGAKLYVDPYLETNPVPMDKKLVQTIEDQCKENNINYQLMHSGAGHDAQIFAPHIPTALLFVPSHKGISHSPDEYTSPEDLAAGVQALIRTLYMLAYQE